MFFPLRPKGFETQRNERLIVTTGMEREGREESKQTMNTCKMPGTVPGVLTRRATCPSPVN